MVDEIHGSVDIVVIQLVDNDNNNNNDDLDDENIVCTYKDQYQWEENAKRISIVRIPQYRLNARSLYCIQKKDIELIRQQFKEQNRLLLKTYQSHAMYSCTIDEFERNISTFFTQTNAYNLIEELNEINPNCIEKYLDNLVDKVKAILDHLLQQQQQSINSIQYEEMQIQRSKVRLDYLFFLPDTRKVNMIHFFFLSSLFSYYCRMKYLYNQLWFLQPVHLSIYLDY